jgi:hypothetical protein
MTIEEVAAYQQRYLERWRRWHADRKWAASNPPTWKPVMTEQQKQEAEAYRIKHSLPF